MPLPTILAAVTAEAMSLSNGIHPYTCHKGLVTAQAKAEA